MEDVDVEDEALVSSVAEDAIFVNVGAELDSMVRIALIGFVSDKVPLILLCCSLNAVYKCCCFGMSVNGVLVDLVPVIGVTVELKR